MILKILFFQQNANLQNVNSHINVLVLHNGAKDTPNELGC